MSKQVARLTDRQCRNAPVGMHHDGAGVYLCCRPAVENRITRSWLYRYFSAGKPTLMGLGSYPTVTLQRAR